MARKGRPRKAGPRQPNGQPSRRAADIIPREVLEQRARAVGVRLTAGREALMRDQRAGTALGVLWMRGVEKMPGLNERQYRAGESLGGLWRLWATMVAAPPRTPVCGEAGGPGVDPNEEVWRRVNGEFMSLRNEVWALPAGVPAWRMLEKVIMGDELPAALSNSSMLDAVQRALDHVAKHFRIPKDLDKAVA